MDSDKNNNFDLLRLFAACQVIFGHSLSHLQIANPILKNLWIILALFPGVPIFFIMSGFLISLSFEKNSNLKYYFTNRILRIYPALWSCFLVSFFVLFATGYLFTAKPDLIVFIKWTIAQLSFIQFYNPLFLNNFGVGVLNGSLWTISVELQFYILIPAIYFFINEMNKKKSNYFLILLIGIFAGINFFVHDYFLKNNFSYKLIHVSFIPHFYFFLMGIFLQRNSQTIIKICANKFFLFFPAYLFICSIVKNHLSVTGNAPNVLITIILALVMMSFVFSFKKLNTILRHNDISYGIYIYHMIVINVFVQYHYIQNELYLAEAMTCTILLAILSWFLVEKPCLKLKKTLFYPKMTGVLTQPLPIES